MASDMLVALNASCAHGGAFFALNHFARCAKSHRMVRVPGRQHFGGDPVDGLAFEIPQVRQTATVLGSQMPGAWGFHHGVNEHQVAVGTTAWSSRLAVDSTGLSGMDLVRLTLERCHSAHQAIEVATDLIHRFGLSGSPDETGHSFLIADPQEAFVLEATGSYWALGDCYQVHAVTAAPLLRQDWRRLSHGFSEFAHDQGWCEDDGQKLDFTACVDGKSPYHPMHRKRWARATLTLEQQNGKIDDLFLRSMTLHQFEQNLHLHPVATEMCATFLVELSTETPLPVAWCCFGPSVLRLFFPVLPIGELPSEYYSTHPEVPCLADRMCALASTIIDESLSSSSVLHALESLQAQFDRDIDRFRITARLMADRREPGKLSSLATRLMQEHVDAFDSVVRHLGHASEPVYTKSEEPAEDCLMYFA